MEMSKMDLGLGFGKEDDMKNWGTLYLEKMWNFVVLKQNLLRDGNGRILGFYGRIVWI